MLLPNSIVFRKILLLFCMFCALGQGNTIAQSVGYVFPKNQSRVEIPFTYQNSFIVLDVRLQGFFPLKFIYDTGAEATIITNPRMAELLDLRYTRKFELMGSDLENTQTAYLIKDVVIDMAIGGAPSQDVLVFDRDHFNLEEYIGENVQGILGNDLFRNYIVTIDYKNEQLVLHKKNKYTPSNKFVAIPMSVEKYKPYISAEIGITQSKILPSKVLIDSGAALSILIDADTTKGLELPEKTVRGRIGFGIGGELKGYVGRIQSIKFGDFEFNNLIANFRVFSNAIDTVAYGKVDRKDGLIGNDVLQNFKCVFDYPNKVFYLKPYYKNYNKRVAFDRSGLSLIMVGKNLQQIMINDVLENSPAEEAGLLRGDIIKSINGIPIFLITYSKVIQKFKRRGNKRYKMKVNRQGKVLLYELKLRDLI